jgi:hypothetical protein
VSVPLLSNALSEPLSELRAWACCGPPPSSVTICLPGRSDGEAILPERPHIDPGVLDPHEGSGCSPLSQGSRLRSGHGADTLGVGPALRDCHPSDP